MIRTIIVYDGIEYTISGQDPDTVRERIRAALETDTVMWLEVNRGDGRPTPAVLLVSRQIPIALITDSDASDVGDPVEYRLEGDDHLLGRVDEGGRGAHQEEDDDQAGGSVEGMTGIEPA